MIINPTKIPQQTLETLKEIISTWYSENKEPNQKLLKTIKDLDWNHTFQAPEYLYRGFSFNDAKTKESVLKDIKNLCLKHPTKKIESWTSSPTVAEEYANGKSSDGNYPLIIKIPFHVVHQKIIWSLEYLFTGKNDKTGIKQKQKFFRLQINSSLNRLLKDIKTQNYRPGQFSSVLKELEIFVPGLVRALTEFEYILPNLSGVDQKEIEIYSNPKGQKEITEMAMNQPSYLGTTTQGRNIYGVAGDGKDNDLGLKTILYQSTGRNSKQPDKFFGTAGINHQSQNKDATALYNPYNMHEGWIVKSSIIGRAQDSKFKTLENGINNYADTKDVRALSKDHPKVQEARTFMNNQKQPQSIKNYPNGELNTRIRNYLKGN